MTSSVQWPLVVVAILAATLLVPASLRQEARSIELLGCAWDHTTITVSMHLSGAASHDAKAMAPPTTRAVVDNWNAAMDRAKSAEGNSLEEFELVEVDRAADITIYLQPDHGGTGTRGHADPQCEEGRMKHVDVIVSGDALWYFFDEVEFGNLVRHELGHALGLGHASFSGNLMSPERTKDRPLGISACHLKALAAVHRWYPGPFAPPSLPSVRCQ